MESDVYTLPELVTKKAVAKWASTTGRTIDRLIARGEFPAPIRLGDSPRWRRSQLAAWLEAQQQR